jgi:hypothetical protein
MPCRISPRLNPNRRCASPRRHRPGPSAARVLSSRATSSSVSRTQSGSVGAIRSAVKKPQRSHSRTAATVAPSRFPGTRDALVYEFDSERDAEAAKAVLLTTAMAAGRPGCVVRARWRNRQRLLAIAV